MVGQRKWFFPRKTHPTCWKNRLDIVSRYIRWIGRKEERERERGISLFDPMKGVQGKRLVIETEPLSLCLFFITFSSPPISSFFISWVSNSTIISFLLSSSSNPSAGTWSDLIRIQYWGLLVHIYSDLILLIWTPHLSPRGSIKFGREAMWAFSLCLLSVLFQSSFGFFISPTVMPLFIFFLNWVVLVLS